MTTPVKAAPDLAVGQASKEATVNAANRRLEQGGDYYVAVDKDLTAPPGSCPDGACYIVAGSPTGLWAGHAGDLAVAVGVNAANDWYYIDPREGTRAYLQDENAEYQHDGASWALFVPGAGSLALDDLTDVSTGGAADGQVLTFDSTSPTGWRPETPVSGVTALDGLSDVDTSGVTDGQVLTYDAASPSGWRPHTPTTGVTTLDSLTDVDTSGVTDGQVLTYDAASPTGWRPHTPTSGVTTLDSLTDVDTAGVADHDSLVYQSASPTGWIRGNPKESLIIAVGDETTAITAGTAKVTWRMPYAFVVTAVRASLTTAQTSGGQVQVDVNEGGTTILSPKLLFDNGSKTTVGSSPQAAITDANLADDAEMTIDIDNVGDGTAKGLKVCLIGYRP